jgi:hypothetical protein
MRVKVYTKQDGGIHSITPTDVEAADVADDTSGEEKGLREQEVEISDSIMESGNADEIIKEAKTKLK